MTRVWLLVAMALVAVGCGSGDDGSPDAAEPDPTTPGMSSTTSTTPSTTEPDATTSTTTTLPIRPRPDWLGTRVLPRTADGFGEVRPTPPELVDRRFATIDLLPPPDNDEFAFTAEPVPDDVLARSTWSSDCPVTRAELRYATVTFWGFDGLVHTGELLIHADAVDAVTSGFAALFEDRFPIEEMRITEPAELDAEPTGDGNNTTAFVCRPARGATSWSEHAYGRAVDINPFHNPYVRGDVVLPELASAYADRDDVGRGMLDATAVRGFTEAGWGWGGTWQSLRDHMHVSASGR